MTYPTDNNRFYSPFISSAQRLPNGNTLITESSGGALSKSPQTTSLSGSILVLTGASSLQ